MQIAVIQTFKYSLNNSFKDTFIKSFTIDF
nr:MAG TPA: hypothetical protein [Caudoviricetes sp.]